jgi:RNA polymerase sigma-70 factor (ECF subfamily)
VSERSARVYCVVPWELAGKLHEPLRRHFRNDPEIDVVIEHRARERRRTADRRAEAAKTEEERRRIKGAGGRRVGERRSAVAAVEPPTLPRIAQRFVDDILFVERLEPSDQHAEDLDTARIVTRIQSGDKDAFSEIYLRYFDRVYSYLRFALEDAHAAEDSTQQVFIKVMEALPRYERRAQPFRAWLFTIVRNHAIHQLQKRARVELVDPVEMAESRDRDRHSGDHAEMLHALGWVSDRDLLMLVERLPVSQRQVLLLRFMMDLTTSDIAAMLGRSTDDVRALQSRALRFLEKRLRALGRAPLSRERTPMRRRRSGGPVLRARRYEHLP